MPVSMMCIRQMGVIVDEWSVAAAMTVRGLGGVAWTVFVLMVLVMLVKMVVLDFLVFVRMAVSLAEKQCDAERHGRHGDLGRRLIVGSHEQSLGKSTEQTPTVNRRSR